METTSVPVSTPPVSAAPATETAQGPQEEAALPANPTGEQAKAFFEAKKAAARKLAEQRQNDDKKANLKQEKTEDVKEQEREAESEVKDKAPAPVKKYKVKVEGAEVEVDEKELLRGYSHQRAANRIMQEGKQKIRQIENVLQSLKSEDNVFEILKELGHDPRKLSEKYLISILEDELLDPKERELKEYKQKFASIEAREQAQREEAEKRHNEEVKARYIKEYNDEFVRALTEKKLPPNKNTVAEMAKYISKALKFGVRMTAGEAAELVKQDLVNYQKMLVSDADGATLVELFGEEVANKIRKHDTSRIKSPENFMKTPAEQGNARTTQQGKMTPQEWLRYKRSL